MIQNMKNFFKRLSNLKWYYQLLIGIATILLAVLLIRFLIWVVPIIGAILAMLFLYTEGGIISDVWSSYKQRKQTPSNPLFSNVYHWLTEEGVTELPLATLQFSQGVEFPDINQGLYFVHINKIISEQEFINFEIKVRQAVKYLSNGHTDAIISKARREPFLAIKIRLVPADDIATKQRQVEEDF